MRLKSLFLAVCVLVTLGCGTDTEQSVSMEQFTPSRIVGTVASPAGGEIAYESNGKGETALVFVHGWCCDRTYWKNQVDAFKDRYQVVTIDLGGHGESRMNRPAWTLEGLIDDVLAVVNSLNLEHMVLIGHSMGGTVVVETAARIPDRVIGIVGVDTLQNVEKKYAEEEFNAFVGPMETDFAGTTVGFVTKGLFRPDSDPALVEQVAQDMAQGPASVGVGLMKNLFNHDLTGALAGLDMPIRLINADLYPTDEEANRRHMKNFGLVLLEGTGHFPQLEDPERFNQALDGVLNEIVASDHQE